MKIIVSSRDAIKSLEINEPYIVISIYGPSDPEGPATMKESKYKKAVLRLAFHDIEKDGSYRSIYPKSKKAQTLVTMTDEHAKAIVEFVTEHICDVEVIVCQCDAGISRSAAVAAALSKCIHGVDDFYFENYLPNMLVYGKVLKAWHR